MSYFTSIHRIEKLGASTVQGGGCSAHFTLNFEGESFENRGGVTFYVADEILTARLIDAINSTIAARKAELSVAIDEERVSQLEGV